jgi:hypothetical protein
VKVNANNNQTGLWGRLTNGAESNGGLGDGQVYSIPKPDFKRTLAELRLKMSEEWYPEFVGFWRDDGQ